MAPRLGAPFGFLSFLNLMFKISTTRAHPQSKLCEIKLDISPKQLTSDIHHEGVGTSAKHSYWTLVIGVARQQANPGNLWSARQRCCFPCTCVCVCVENTCPRNPTRQLFTCWAISECGLEAIAIAVDPQMYGIKRPSQCHVQ